MIVEFRDGTSKSLNKFKVLGRLEFDKEIGNMLVSKDFDKLILAYLKKGLREQTSNPKKVLTFEDGEAFLKTALKTFTNPYTRAVEIKDAEA